MFWSYFEWRLKTSTSWTMCPYLDKVSSLLWVSSSYGSRVDQKSCQLTKESSETTDKVATKHCLELEEPEFFKIWISTSRETSVNRTLHLLLSVILARSAMTSSFSKTFLPARTWRPSEEYRGGVPSSSIVGVGERFREAITSLFELKNNFWDFSPTLLWQNSPPHLWQNGL